MYPRLVTDLNKVKFNVDRIVEMCHARGCTAAIVTKCVCADQRVVDVINATKADFIADSRIANLARMKTSKPRYLLRLTQACEVRDVIAHSEVSQESEISTIKLIGAEAKRQMRRHKVVVMIDMGDLREGVFYKNRDDVLALAKAVCDEEMLELYGVGVNLTCFGGIIPDETNLSGLVDCARFLRAQTGREIPLVSGGNSSSLPMLESGRLPEGINNLRIGEGWLLGNETVEGTLMPGFDPMAFTLEAQLIEVKTKPSKPIGTSGLNAFGEKVTFEDRGETVRGICAVGRQDTATDGLTPVDAELSILGSSSDHLIVDLTRARGRYRTGDILAFSVSYGALLHAATGGYVEKAYK